MAIEWTQNLAVGVTEIDNQHKELFKRVNQYLEAMMERRGKEEIGKVIKFLENYVVTHFGTEERYMELHNYPDQRLHKEQHAAFIKTFNDIRAIATKTAQVSTQSSRRRKGSAKGSAHIYRLQTRTSLSF